MRSRTSEGFSGGPDRPREVRTTLAMLIAVALAGCGRLGFELYALDAGADAAPNDGPDAGAESASKLGMSSMGSSSARGMGPTADASVSRMRVTAADAGLSQVAPRSDVDAAVDAQVSTRSDASAGATLTSADRLDDGAACAADDACNSGVCFGGVCCETRCDSPPTCYVADGASCSDGRCLYVAAASGSTCDDGDSCTTQDSCANGACAGVSRCDDGNPCTQDFCGDADCGHASTCRPSDSACTYTQSAGHGYWMCPGPVSFDAARKECERIGASIVTINDDAEQSLLWNLGMRDTWIGYRASGDSVDAGFAWVTGSSEYEDWAEDDLDAGAGDRCAFIAAQQMGAWQARACEDDFSGFACEIDGYALPDASCRYARRAGHGYYSCETLRTWTEAAQRCAEIGAYLVELADPAEQSFVRQTLMAGMSYAIGVSDAQMEGVFTSSRWALVSYTAWGPEQPDASGPELDYAVLSAGSGNWRTVGPDAHNGYICEQER